jgi:hypothetical protein
MLLNKKTIHSVLFWGKTNREIFFKVGLPTILSNGNLDKESKHIFFMITTKQDLKEIRKENSFKILDKRAEIKSIYIDDDLAPKFGKAAEINTKYVKITMNKAFNLNCGHFCWSADSIVSNNLFLKIYEKILDGYQGIGSPGNSIYYSRKNINFLIKRKKFGIININSKELIKFALKNKGKLYINNVIDNKLKVRSQYPSGVCYENLNFRLGFSHKCHPLYLEPQVKITHQFIGSVDYALASIVIDLKKYYILNSFTENQLEKEKYLYFDHQDPTFFGFSDHKKSIHSIHHLNGCITPKIMAYHWSNTCFKNDKYLSKNLIIQNWIADKNLKKKIILIQKFRRQVLIFLVLYKIYNFIVFFLFYKLKNLFKKIIFIVKIIIKKLLRSLVKIFNFSVYKI